MSKSLGNGVDPMDVIDEYGADSLRYFLATGSSPGTTSRHQLKKLSQCGTLSIKSGMGHVSV